MKVQQVESVPPETYYPGTRVNVFDPRLYKNDVVTPPEVTIRPATVIRWYGKKTRFGVYPSLIDVVFDHSPLRISKAHFADSLYVTILQK